MKFSFNFNRMRKYIFRDSIKMNIRMWINYDEMNTEIKYSIQHFPQFQFIQIGT